MKFLEASAHGKGQGKRFLRVLWIPILLTWITYPNFKKAIASFNNFKTQETSIKEANKQNIFCITSLRIRNSEKLELRILLHMTPVEITL